MADVPRAQDIEILPLGLKGFLSVPDGASGIVLFAHRPIAVAHDALGRGADEELLQSLLAGLPNHNQIGVSLPCLLNDDCKWLTDFYIEPDAGAVRFRQLREPVTQILFGKCMSAFSDFSYETGFHDMQQSQRCTSLAAELSCALECSPRLLAEIGRCHNVLNA